MPTTLLFPHQDSYVNLAEMIDDLDAGDRLQSRDG